MNKHIEEIIAATELCDKPCDICKMEFGKCMPFRNARKLVNAGYRKQVEGEWIVDEHEWDFPPYFYYDCKCSVCGNREQNRSPYCRECGARMKGE